MIAIQGTSIIGFQRGQAGGQAFQAINPAIGTPLPEPFFTAQDSEVDQACALAQAAADTYAAVAGEKRAAFLEAAADRLTENADCIAARYVLETGLPEGRARGELGRTTSQLRLFAQLVREGHWVNARIETALPDRTPLPKPDIRSQLEPLGPVAVFCASNFPLAFSVAGGDTASALAAGCPVIVLAHAAHPGTAELAGACVSQAARDTGMPAGVFSMLQGPGRTVGVRLVGHPAMKAVGFTGSRSGGHALMQVAGARPQPIPVYAEMSSVNPVVLLGGALREENRVDLVTGLVGSLTLGVGQFCTNPGLVFLPAGPDADAFASSLADALSKHPAGTMLTRGIADAYEQSIQQRAATEGVHTLYRDKDTAVCAGGTAAFQVEAATWVANPELQSESFGPSTLLVTYRTVEELIEALQTLEGQLTGTLHAAESDHPLPAALVSVLKSKVGRLILNQFPTGVEVCHAMVHGGPYPATSDGRSTSVGTMAIERFCRPVCYQNFPETELPPALRDDNPLGLWRLVDGTRRQ